MYFLQLSRGIVMQVSQHATTRSQQRGISRDCINLIIDVGVDEKRPGGALEYKLRIKDKERLIKYYKHQMHLVVKASKNVVLVSNNKENIITVYNTG